MDEAQAVEAAAAIRAAAGIKPSASNTGVIPGTALTLHNGDLVITTAGTVIQNLDIRGNVNVKASNVTIRNCYIRGPAVAPTGNSLALIMQYNPAITGLLVEDCTLRSQSPNLWTNGILGSGYTMRRCDISHTVDGADACAVGNVLVDSCFIHDGAYFTPTSTHNDNQSHDDGIQITNGNNIVYTNNYITSFSMSCFMVGQAQGPVTGLKIVNNWLDGGTANINLASMTYGQLVPTITGNRFGRSRANTYQILAAGNISLSKITGNVWDDTGLPVKIVVT